MDLEDIMIAERRADGAVRQDEPSDTDLSSPESPLAEELPEEQQFDRVSAVECVRVCL